MIFSLIKSKKQTNDITNIVFVLGCRTNRAKLTCEICNKSYVNRYSYFSHKNKDCNKPKKFTCVLCGYSSKRKHNLKQHIRAIHQ